MNTTTSSLPQGRQPAELQSASGYASPKRPAIKPECFRLPSGRERDPYFGLGRSYWNSLILATPANDHKPMVKSYVIRRRGSRTGVRLIDFDSALAFIQQHKEKSDIPSEGLPRHGATSENPILEAPAAADQHPLGGRR